MKHEQQEKEVRKRIKEDIKNELNPLYSISIGSWYSEKEMLEDVSQLMIAENDVGFQAGKSQAIQEVKKLLNEIGDKFYYHSDIDGVDLKLSELTEYQEFIKTKLAKLEKKQEINMNNLAK